MRLSAVRNPVSAHRPSPRRLRITAAVVTSLGLAALVSACNPFSSATAASGEPAVKVGVVPGIDNATLYLAKKRGFFTQAGINVHIVDFSSVRTEMRALSAGAVNVAAGDYGELFATQPAVQRNAYKILADGYDAAPGVVQIMTMPNSRITSPADLATYAIGAPDSDQVLNAPAGAPDSLLTASATSVMQSYGVNLSGVKWKYLSQQQEISDLVHGQLQAILVTEPYVFAAQQAGAVELMDACSGATVGIPLSGYFSSTSWAREQTKEVAAFRAGLARADALTTMPGPVQAILPGYARLTRQEAALVTTGVYPLSTITASIQRTADLMFRVGMIRDQINVAKMIAQVTH